MRTRMIAVALMVAVATGMVAAQERAEPAAYEEFTRGLGFSGGALSGFGISYRTWILPNTGVQVCAGALYLPPGLGWFSSNLLDYWVSLEGMRTLYATEFTPWLFGQLYLFAGLHHSGYIPWEAIYGTVVEGELSREEFVEWEQGRYTPRAGVGLGFGVEVGLFRHLSGSFELGYAVFWDGSGGSFVDQLLVDLVPQGSFHFRY